MIHRSVLQKDHPFHPLREMERGKKDTAAGVLSCPSEAVAVSLPRVVEAGQHLHLGEGKHREAGPRLVCKINSEQPRGPRNESASYGRGGGRLNLISDF